MTNRVEMDALIDEHIARWTLPCALQRDNEPSPRRETEWMRLVVLDGFGILQGTAGLKDITGSTVAHGFVLAFDIWTPINTGRLRQSEIAQSISDHWAYVSLSDLHFDAATFGRVGEESPHYHRSVSIDAARYETLAARPHYH